MNFLEEIMFYAQTKDREYSFTATRSSDYVIRVGEVARIVPNLMEESLFEAYIDIRVTIEVNEQLAKLGIDPRVTIPGSVAKFV